MWQTTYITDVFVFVQTKVKILPPHAELSSMAASSAGALLPTAQSIVNGSKSGKA